MLHQRWRRGNQGHLGTLTPGTTDCVIFHCLRPCPDGHVKWDHTPTSPQPLAYTCLTLIIHVSQMQDRTSVHLNGSCLCYLLRKVKSLCASRPTAPLVSRQVWTRTIRQIFKLQIGSQESRFICDPPSMSLQRKYQADKISFSPSEISGNMWSTQMSLLSYTYMKEENWLILVFQRFWKKKQRSRSRFWRRRMRQIQGEATKSSSPRKWLGVFETIN